VNRVQNDIRNITGQYGLVSALCVTEDRPAFIPWLEWNFCKQDYPDAELVVVDSSRNALPFNDSDRIRVLHCEPGTSVARKRNLAMEAARGDIITWFDDDDWQHPRKLSLLASALRDDGVLTGSCTSWFVDLARGRARPYAGSGRVLFNSLGARRSVVSAVPFDERLKRAADTAWFTALRRAGVPEPVVLPEILSFWLCHDRNLSNPASRYVFSSPMSELGAAIGAEPWGDTEAHLPNLAETLDVTELQSP
jgi:Glycosyl transferase family 2